MYEDSIREEFTHQSGSFGKAAVMTSAETLGALVELVPADAGARWIESACGTGLVARALARKVGSAAEHEQPIPLDIDFEDWLERGSGGCAAAPLVDELLAQRPEGAESFHVTAGEQGRRLRQRYWLGRWRRPT